MFYDCRWAFFRPRWPYQLENSLWDYAFLIGTSELLSDLMVALIWPLQRREDAVKTKRKESLYRIFYRRNVQFPRLQRLTASIFWWLCTLFEFSYFYTFSTDHKSWYISDFSFMGEIKCSVCLCFCHFGPDRDTWSIKMKVPHWAISQLTFMVF